MQAIIFGASDGIGAELVAQLSERPDVSRVHAVSRRGTAVSGKIVSHTADITAESDLSSLANALEREQDIRLVIVATGILSDGDALFPEKSYRH